MRKWRSIALLAALAVATQLYAQIGFGGSPRGGGHFGSPGALPPGISFGSQGQRASSGQGFPGNNGLFLGTPWLFDYPAGTPPVQTQPIIVVQSPTAPAPVQETRPISPLLIEWQGDRYVRFNGSGERGRAAEADYSDASAVKSVGKQGASPAAPHELPPVSLVYRDGHREDLRRYAIIDNVIYVEGDYWSDGYWRKTIQMSLLNLPETIRMNQERGVKFRLPSGPNEVVTRP